MARPINFEFVIRVNDPKAAYEALLSAPASPEALRMLKEASQLDMSVVEIDEDDEKRDLR